MRSWRISNGHYPRPDFTLKKQHHSKSMFVVYEPSAVPIMDCMTLEDLKRRLPTRQQLTSIPLLRPFASRLLDPQVWHFNRRSTSNAMCIGLVIAWLPFPGQTFAAAIAAVLSRSNLPVSVSLTWISNPLTFAPMYFFAYKLGAWLLDAEPAFSQFVFSFSWIFERLEQIWQPLLLGVLICAWVTGVTGLVIVRSVWRLWIVRRWKLRLKLAGLASSS